MDYDDRLLITGQGEDAVVRALHTAGFLVTNLNEVSLNFPFADLLVRENGQRALIQVKSTTTDNGKFIAPSDRASKFNEIASLLGVSAVYAFVHFNVVSALNFWEGVWREERAIWRHVRTWDEFESERIRFGIPKRPIPFSDKETTIRFEDAARVAHLAERAENGTNGICRYTVSIDDFIIDATNLSSILTGK